MPALTQHGQSVVPQEPASPVLLFSLLISWGLRANTSGPCMGATEGSEISNPCCCCGDYRV